MADVTEEIHLSSQSAWALQYVDGKEVKSVRKRVRGWCRHAALYWLGWRTAATEPAFLRCLFCHYVYDDQISAFRRQLEALQSIGRFLSTDDVLAVVRGERALDGRCFHLSIDDGFDNVYRNAFPVLRDMGIPATIFIPSRYVGSADDEIMSRWWLHGRVRKPTKPMKWAWVRELADAGYDIGSHTRHHVRLSTIARDSDRLIEEIISSKKDIEDNMGRPCRFFAWPYGRYTDIHDQAMQCIEQAGYECAFSAEHEQVVPGRTSRYAIPRYHFEPQDPWLHVRYFALGGQERARA